MSSEQKKKEDTYFCRDVLGIENGDFEQCWRAGKIDEAKPDNCRTLVIKMTDEDTVRI